MARLCLPENKRDALKKALKNGDVVISELYEMSSKERNALFSKYVGDSANIVNAKFEQAMLSTQKVALKNWIKSSISAKDPIRKDILKRVERVKKFLDPDDEFGFLEDVAADKLGIRVTEKEAKQILDLKATVDELKVKIPVDSPRASTERMEYGLALDRFKTLVGDLKLDAEKLSPKERLKLKNIGQNIVDLGSVTKSMVATLDNSFIGRQGIKTLLDGKYKIWGNTLKESFKNFGKELFAKSPGLFKSRDDAVMAAIRADIYSRPNALNGKYNAAKNGYGLGVLFEEAFPTSIPERIPFLGRVFKASETAFGGSALRMRADLADAIITKAEQNGLDMLDEKNASAFGSLVTSMTGRGELGVTAPIGKQLNALFFSPRFLKSNWNTLTAHTFDKAATLESRREAAKSLARISGSIFGLLAFNEAINPGSVEWDPRKTHFGKMKFGDRFIDITGGMGGLVRLGARLATGKTYSSNTRKWTDLYSGEGFGTQTGLDVVEDFIEGKFSPAAGAVRDFARGRNFEGEKPDFMNTTLGLVTPISYEMFTEELRKGSSDIGMVMLAEGLGFSPSSATYRGYGNRWDTLKNKNEDDYNEALRQVSQKFNQRANRLEASSRWDTMSQEERNDALDGIRSEETDRALRQYGI